VAQQFVINRLNPAPVAATPEVSKAKTKSGK
jgi:hypothetical protein